MDKYKVPPLRSKKTVLGEAGVGKGHCAGMAVGREFANWQVKFYNGRRKKEARLKKNSSGNLGQKRAKKDKKKVQGMTLHVSIKQTKNCGCKRKEEKEKGEG